MKIVFNTDECTCLRYFLPIAKKIREGYEVDIRFAVNNWGNKYNRLNIKQNHSSFLRIMNEHEFNYFVIDGRVDCDILFSVEILNYLDKNYCCGKHYAIQHGYDFMNLGKRFPNKATYIFADEIFGEEYDHYVNDYVVSPLPVVFWDYVDDISNVDKGRCFIFAPEHGYLKKLEYLVNFFSRKKFDVVVKQRRKSQNVNRCAKNVVYDDIWYPSEAIDIPIKSGIIIGFNSSAYVDFFGAKRKYVNLAIGNEEYDQLKRYFFPEKSDCLFNLKNITEIKDCGKFINEDDLNFSSKRHMVHSFVSNLLDV